MLSFNTVNHDILMGIVRSRIADVRVIKLIRKYLSAGVMVGGLTTPAEKGTPQGGPMTPRTQKITFRRLLNIGEIGCYWHICDRDGVLDFDGVLVNKNLFYHQPQDFLPIQNVQRVRCAA